MSRPSGIQAPPPEVIALAQPRVGRAARRGLRGAYDYLGTVLFGSALWTCLAVLLGAGGTGLVAAALGGRNLWSVLLAELGGVVVAGIGTGPLTAALFDQTRRLVIHEDPSWWELPRTAMRLWRRGLALSALQVGVGLVLTADTLWFMTREPALLRLAGVLFLYPLLFWWGAALLQWPLAAECAGESLWQIVKKSFLLLLDNLGYMASVATALALLAALCGATQIGLVLAWAGTAAFIQTAALRELLPKYGLLAQPDVDAPVSDA